MDVTLEWSLSIMNCLSSRRPHIGVNVLYIGNLIDALLRGRCDILRVHDNSHHRSVVIHCMPFIINYLLHDLLCQ